MTCLPCSGMGVTIGHPNRDLYFDDVVTILLLGFFNADIRFPARRDLNSSVRCRALNSV